MVKEKIIRQSLEKIIGKKIIIGFGRDNKRLAILNGREGFTLYASEGKIKIDKKEEITTAITPRYGVKCLEAGSFLGNEIILFKLGQHRQLSASYIGENELKVTYLPDEKELENNESEFMNKCSYRGLI